MIACGRRLAKMERPESCHDGRLWAWFIKCSGCLLSVMDIVGYCCVTRKERRVYNKDVVVRDL